MRERLEERLDTLRAEHQAGERMRARLQAEKADVEQTLLRISGAIQVLEELLAADDHPDLSLLAPPPAEPAPEPEVTTG